MSSIRRKRHHNSFNGLAEIVVYLYFKLIWTLFKSTINLLSWLFNFSVSTLSRFIRNLFNKNTSKPLIYSLSQIDSMDGYEFEKCMADVYKRLGYSVYHTPLAGDQGADLIITSNKGIRIAVQCKCYSNKVSNKAVQEVVASKAIHRCTKGIVVTNNYFTDSAKQLARANDIDLIDRSGLTKLIYSL